MATTSFKRGSVEDEAEQEQPVRQRRTAREINQEDEPVTRRRPTQPEPEGEEPVQKARIRKTEEEPGEDPNPRKNSRTQRPKNEEEDPPPTSRALVRRPQQAVGRPHRFRQMEGEFTSSDAAMPYLNLGQKTGNLCEDHHEWIGTFVYDKSVGLGDEIRVVFSFLKKRYEEVTDFDSPDIPMLFDTKAAAETAGVQVRDIAELTVWIEVNPKSKAFRDNKGMLVDGDYGYVPAKYVVRSTAYGRTVGILFKDLPRSLDGEFINGFYIMTTEKKTKSTAKGTNSWHVPVLTHDGPTPDSLREMLAAIMQGPDEDEE